MLRADITRTHALIYGMPRTREYLQCAVKETVLKNSFTLSLVVSSVLEDFCNLSTTWWGLTHWPLGNLNGNFRHVIFKQILVIDGWGISCEIALIWMSLDFTDDQSTMVQVMAWYRQATGHYLSQCWPRSLPPNGVTRPQWVINIQYKISVVPMVSVAVSI